MVKVGVSFYYIGDINRATDLYSRLLGSAPSYVNEDWVRFHLEGGDIALHLDPGLQPTIAAEPVRFGAIVSLTVEDIRAFLELARDLGFIVLGDTQDLPYGLQAELRDPWGNRLSVLEPKKG
jgi:predicted enzyme related to lactoylglutathione lyase